MKKTLAAVLLALSLPTVGQVSQDPAPPTFRLGDAATPRAYDLTLAIDPREDHFTGTARIDFHLGRAMPVLWLNAEKLEIAQATFTRGGEQRAARVIAAKEDFVGFALEGGFEPGDYVAEIRYTAPIEDVATRGLFRQQEGGEWYAVSQFEATYARRAFPSFDEPQWKTPWRVTIDAPSSDRVISNTPEETVGSAPGRSGWQRHVFARTRPLPSYLVAFAVGPFDVVDGGKSAGSGTPMRYFAPKGRAAEARFARDASPRVLGLLESYFGIPYPFEKLDAVPIPATVGFGAMENVGMITYTSELMLARPSRESLAFKRGYASVAAHEMAHQWFGDLVTLAWWDDTWLNEGFASWMGRKTMRAYDPEGGASWRFAEGRRRAIRSDRLMSARRVANPVVGKNDIYNAFDGITYSKGAEVLSMFETWLGPDSFRDGVRQYLKDHAYANATSADFFRALGAASGRGEVAVAAFRSFIEQPGLPLLDGSLSCEAGKASISVRPQRLVPKGTQGPAAQWTIPACFTYAVGDRVAKQCAEVAGARTITLEQATQCPDWVTGNAEGAGHYATRWERGAAQKLIAHAASLPEREAVAVAANAELLMTSGLIAPAEALQLADALFGHASLAVKQAAVHILVAAQDADLSSADHAVWRAAIEKRMFPLADQVGWTPRENESLDAEDLRTFMMPFAASQAGGERFRASVRKLGVTWLEKPDSVPGSIATAALRTTGRFADAALYQRLEDALAKTSDRRDRVDLLGALSAVQEPTLRDRAYGLTLAQRGGADAMSGRDVMTFLEKGLDDWYNRAYAFAFLRSHWDAIAAKLPPESEWRLMREMDGLCTAADRDAFKAFFRPRAPHFEGGPRAYQQAAEAMDICVASLKHGA
jgi:alanyl aminopeptidase